LGVGEKVSGLVGVEVELLEAVKEVAAVGGGCAAENVVAIAIDQNLGVCAVIGGGNGLSGQGLRIFPAQSKQHCAE